jgi:hypothetical protein
MARKVTVIMSGWFCLRCGLRMRFLFREKFALPCLALPCLAGRCMLFQNQIKFKLSVWEAVWYSSIPRPPSSLTEGWRYITDGVRLAQRPRRGANRQLR